MTEVKETKELSELLLKATTQPLSSHRKTKVQEQLMDIARSIPALAILLCPEAAYFTCADQSSAF